MANTGLPAAKRSDLRFPQHGHVSRLRSDLVLLPGGSPQSRRFMRPRFRPKTISKSGTGNWSVSYTMTLAIILVIAAALALVCILGFTVSRSLQVSKSSGLATRIQPIDVEAFRNLVDPAEDDYLRRRLPAGEFRHVRRERLARHGGLRAGRGTKCRHSDTHWAERSGLQRPEHGRSRTASWSISRYCCAATRPSPCSASMSRWPGRTAGLAATPVLEGYEQLNGSAMLLGRLQNPAAPVRISAQ